MRFLFLLFFWLVPISSPVRAQDPTTLELAKRFMARFQTIQVAIPSSSGNGFMGAGLDVIEGLERLGFGSRIQGRFAGDPDRLEPLLMRLAPERLDPESPFSLKMHAPRNGSALEISGGGVWARSTGLVNIQLQPPFWTEAPAAIYFGNDASSALKVGQFSNYAMYVKEQSVSEVVSYAQSYQPELAGNIAYLLNGRSNIAWMPVYGVGFGGVEKVAKLIVSLRNIRKELNQRGYQGAPVIVLESRLNESEMQAVLDSVAASAKPGQEINVQVVDGKWGDLERIQREVTASTVIVVKFGTVSQQVFKGLMQWSPLPVVVSGVGALNQARYLGRPYLVTDYKMRLGQDNAASHREFMELGTDRLIQDQGLQRSHMAFDQLTNPL